MATVFDLAAYILSKTGSITTMKLQNLVYYSQVWSLVWDEKPIFRNRIEAWANGPVVPALCREHHGMFKISALPRGDASKLTKEQRETVDAVLDFYGKKNSQWLSDLSHAEAPWKDVRGDCSPGEARGAEITLSAMAEYYANPY